MKDEVSQRNQGQGSEQGKGNKPSVQGGIRHGINLEIRKNQGKEPAAIDGFTATQRFYLGYAALWGQNIRNEEILRLTKIDPHSLGKWRVNAALRNVDDFYKAFNITENDAMFMKPEERVVIW